MSKIVTFEQAKKLEILGFYEWTFYLYDKDTGKNHHAFEQIIELNKVSDYYKAPTVSEALDFIREEKRVLCAVELIKVTNRFGELRYYKYRGVYIGKDNKEILLNEEDTHPLAKTALLTAVLEYLEKGGNDER